MTAHRNNLARILAGWRPGQPAAKAIRPKARPKTDKPSAPRRPSTGRPVRPEPAGETAAQAAARLAGYVNRTRRAERSAKAKPAARGKAEQAAARIAEAARR